MKAYITCSWDSAMEFDLAVTVLKEANTYGIKFPQVFHTHTRRNFGMYIGMYFDIIIVTDDQEFTGYLKHIAENTNTPVSVKSAMHGSIDFIKQISDFISQDDRAKLKKVGFTDLFIELPDLNLFKMHSNLQNDH